MEYAMLEGILNVSIPLRGIEQATIPDLVQVVGSDYTSFHPLAGN